MQGITRCAHQHSRIDFLYCSQTLQAIHATTRNGESTEAFGSLIGRPETNKRAKTKGQKDDIITSNTWSATNSCLLVKGKLERSSKLWSVRDAVFASNFSS